MPRLLIILTGGTFAMVSQGGVLVPCPDMAGAVASLVDSFSSSCEFEIVTLAPPIDSANATPEHWYRLAALIARQHEAFDGFLVIHGTDTMAYAASGLSFALQGIAKPLVFTGAQIPLGMPDSDARANLAAAIAVCASGRIREVCICFGSRILRGNRATKVRSTGREAFDSPNFPHLGRIGDSGGPILPSEVPMPPCGGSPRFETDLLSPPRVGIVWLHPGIDADQIGFMLGSGRDGLILATYGMGNGPAGHSSILDALAEGTGRGKVIVAISQCLYGGVDLRSYATGAALAEAGIVGGRDMTLEAAFAKLVHLLGRGLPHEAVRDIMAGVSLAGEC